MPRLGLLLCAGVFLTLAAPSAWADKPADRGDTPGLGWGPGGSQDSRAVPGPVAGVGVPALLAAGGLLWLVRRKRQGAASQPE